MKGDPKVIEYLNRGLRSELTAVSQYWLHYRVLDDWGYKELAKTWRKESIEEMHHADKLHRAHHLPRRLRQPAGARPSAHRPDHQGNPRGDLAAEYDARNLYGEAAAYCESVGDRVSKNLFEELMKDEEGHIDFLETQLNLVEQVGVAALCPEAYRRARKRPRLSLV